MNRLKNDKQQGTREVDDVC